MQRRQLGIDGPEVSVIGLGTWAIGGGDWPFGWGEQDEHDAIETIHRAVDLGINWIDTAAVYGFGKSERLVGRALASIAAEDRPLIATKCGRIDNGDGTIGKSLIRQSVINECEASLQRLGVECIDLYQMHWPEPDEQIEEGWETLLELQKQGKVRYVGVSNHSVSQMQRLQVINPIQSSQPPYSMIADEAEESVLPHCGDQGIGVVCYSPMGKGVLTGAFDAKRASSLAENDHRRHDPRFQSPQLEINLRFVQSIEKIATRLGWTVAELSIAWVLRLPVVTSAIVGSRSASQIEQTAIAASRELDEATEREIAVLINMRKTLLTSVQGV
jgi:aryl-alcohol dehydrogenase-like predicted oxidoreductase